MLATGALVASLLAVGASPAGAEIDEQDNKAKTSACMGDALGDQMFTDVSDMHAFSDAINCVAYYGITNGTGDGSTYSPNQNVTRAEMAVFIARAAGAAGVDLGDAMDEGFTDIGDMWQEAQDAINQLAGEGIIDGGGAYRPGDDITRIEMASFLIGLLNAAAPNVTIDSAGDIKLGEGAGTDADDHFGDVRATQPVAADNETAALYELGVTNGAGPAAGAVDGEAPIDTNYEPDGTVNRGEMAAFITRALAHTSVRPAGISAQFDGSDVVLSARDDDFQPMANVTIDTFRIETNDVELAFRGDGSCGEVSKISASGTYECEIDGADPITGGDGDTGVTLDGGVDRGGTTVWAWTGDNGDVIDDDTEGVYKLEISEAEAKSIAVLARVSTEFTGAKAHLGSSVLYTLQLEQDDGDPATSGVDGEKPAKYFVTMDTYAMVPDPTDTDPTDGVPMVRNPQGNSIRTTIPLTTDADGKATFSVSGLPDTAPNVKDDKYSVDIYIQGHPGPDETNDPPAIHLGDSETPAAPLGNGLVLVRAGAPDTTDTDPDGLIFSTEASSRAQGDVVVSVKAAADHVVSSGRGSSARATVSVVDQYGDPIPGARVSLTSTGAPNADAPTEVVIGGGRFLAVGRDGTHTFGYERVNSAQAEETLTPAWDHDNDGCTATLIADTDHRCSQDPDGDGPLSTGTIGVVGNTDTVSWAAPATADQTDQEIREFDTETNTIFAGNTGATVWMITYDENDRFDIGAAGSETASDYAAFERALAKGLDLDWDITGTGSRAINVFTLSTS